MRLTPKKIVKNEYPTKRSIRNQSLHVAKSNRETDFAILIRYTSVHAHVKYYEHFKVTRFFEPWRVYFCSLNFNLT